MTYPVPPIDSLLGKAIEVLLLIVFITMCPVGGGRWRSTSWTGCGTGCTSSSGPSGSWGRRERSSHSETGSLKRYANERKRSNCSNCSHWTHQSLLWHSMIYFCSLQYLFTWYVVPLAIWLKKFRQGGRIPFEGIGKWPEIIPVWWEIPQGVFRCMGTSVLRHPSYMPGYPFPFCISVGPLRGMSAPGFHTLVSSRSLIWPRRPISLPVSGSNNLWRGCWRNVSSVPVCHVSLSSCYRAEIIYFLPLY